MRKIGCNLFRIDTDPVCAAGTILPTGKTPGAAELGVPKFIEEMVNKVYKKEQQFTFVSKQSRMMVEGDKAHPHGVRTFFRNIKELTLVGYFNTEVGATKVLQHKAVPGYYDDCMPIEEVGNGKTWAV